MSSPNDFVALPASRARSEIVDHDSYHASHLTGTLHLVYSTVTPLHVGSGVFETAQECGLGDGPIPVRGIMRRRGKPVLPGSGWKGAVRARYEAITDSRLALVDTRATEPAFKVPEALRGSKSTHQVVIQDPRLRDLGPLGTVTRDSGLHRSLPLPCSGVAREVA